MFGAHAVSVPPRFFAPIGPGGGGGLHADITPRYGIRGL
jgi:hypothetical protein